VAYEVRDEREYEVPAAARVLVEDGQKVKAGDQLTEGAKNPHRILRILGRDATQLYLLQEIQKVYRSQGVNINDKHFEVIIKKMLGKVQITSSGDSELLPASWWTACSCRTLTSGCTKWQAACHGRAGTVRCDQVGAHDRVIPVRFKLPAHDQSAGRSGHRGQAGRAARLKENVIIGKLIPAGTGFKKDAQPDQTAVVPAELADLAGLGLSSRRNCWTTDQSQSRTKAAPGRKVRALLFRSVLGILHCVTRVANAAPSAAEPAYSASFTLKNGYDYGDDHNKNEYSHGYDLDHAHATPLGCRKRAVTCLRCRLLCSCKELQHPTHQYTSRADTYPITSAVIKPPRKPDRHEASCKHGSIHP